MTHRGPVRVEDIPGFDTLIDARSPSEFALDRIPGAINCPSLDDEERRIVGTLYKQKGAFEARRVGGAMVAANLARHLREQFADRPEAWRPLVYCWRGGLRSGSVVQWLRLVGWDAQQLAGGYKSYRRHVVAALAERSQKLRIVALCGMTGSAKTRILQALARQGAQVLDLEALACHKGSLLGALPGVPQPTQKAFETSIATVIAHTDMSRVVFLEAESARIGRLSVPLPLLARLRDAACLEIVATSAERLDYLLRDYAYLGDDPETLATQLGLLRELHGKEVVARWQDWVHQCMLSPLFTELMAEHYDPHYARSQARHFSRWAERDSMEAHSLAPAGIEELARSIIARCV